MPKTRISCPNCHQPILGEIDQVFDLNQDPAAKQRLLTGAFNIIQCPNCGYRGGIATPIIYHDPDKELLLTFVPVELGLPRDEQERLIGGLINQVINKLPQEKRKAYLLQPQAALTLQGLMERVLEADGITREMLQAQQKRLSLLQRLVNASEQERETIAQQEDELIDADFFNILRRLAETAMMSGDQQAANKLAELQKALLPITTFGHQVQQQTREVEAAVADLQALGKELNRESVLDLVIKAETDTRLGILVSLTRPLMDYAFFQLMSEKIDRARGEGRNRLTELRTKLLEMTQEIDRRVEEHVAETRRLIEAILKSDNVREAAMESLPAVDEFFIQEVSQMLDQARKQGDLDKSSKLQQIITVLQEASTPPPEAKLLEDYLEIADDANRKTFLEKNADQINQEFMDMLASIAAQVQSRDDPEFADRVKAAHRQALRFSMVKNLQGS